MTAHSNIVAWRIPWTDHGVTKSQIWQRDKHFGPPWCLLAQTVKNPPAMQETWVQSLGWEDPLEEGMTTHSTILVCRIPMDRGAWLGTVHGVTKSQTWLSNFHSVTHFHAQNVSVWTIRSAFRLVPMFFWHPIVFLWAFSYFLGPGSLFFLFSPGINHFSKKSQFHLLVYI